jgi:hypothetical protein
LFGLELNSIILPHHKQYVTRQLAFRFVSGHWIVTSISSRPSEHVDGAFLGA